MNTPSFVERTPDRPGTARLQSKSSWFDVVWSRWHADGRPYPRRDTVGACEHLQRVKRRNFLSVAACRLSSRKRHPGLISTLSGKPALAGESAPIGGRLFGARSPDTPREGSGFLPRFANFSRVGALDLRSV